MYNDVLIGLKGSKSIFICRSFPLSVNTAPQYTTSPFGGTLLYSFKRCCAEPIASSTDCRLTRDLMFVAVPISSINIFCTRFTCPFGGITSEIIDVPFPRASSSFLMSYVRVKRYNSPSVFVHLVRDADTSRFLIVFAPTSASSSSRQSHLAHLPYCSSSTARARGANVSSVVRSWSRVPFMTSRARRERLERVRSDASEVKPYAHST